MSFFDPRLGLDVSSNPRRAKWTADQIAHDHALRTGPTAALEHFRTIYSLRSSNPITQNDELYRLSDVLNDYFALCGSTDDIWRACTDNAFILFLLDVMTDPDFLCHFSVFSMNICMLVMWVVSLLDNESVAGRELDDQHLRRLWPPGLVKAFQMKIEAVWTRLWDQRSCLLQRSGPDRDRMLEQLDAMSYTILSFHKTINPKARASRKMAMFNFYAWVQLHGADGRTEGDMPKLYSSHYALCILDDHLYILLEDTGAPQAFMKELIEDAGTSQSFHAVQNALKASPLLVNSALYSCLRMLGWQYRALDLDAYSDFPILPSISKALLRQHAQNDSPAGSRLPVNTRLHIVRGSFQHIIMILVGVELGFIDAKALSSESAYALWSMFLCAFTYGSAAEESLRQIHDNATREQLAADLSEYLADVVGTIGKTTDAVREGRLAKVVVNQLRGAATARAQGIGMWYSTILDLSSAMHLSTSPETVAAFRGAWRSLGKAFDIDEITERDHLKAYRAHLCWWKDCKYHTTQCPARLSVCKGCKENQYCSKACQIRDWKEGGHRAQCGRRVKK